VECWVCWPAKLVNKSLAIGVKQASILNPNLYSLHYQTRLAGGPLLRVATIRCTTDTFLSISHTTNVLLFKFRCNIFIGVRIIKDTPGSVASGTHYILLMVSNWASWSGRPFIRGSVMVDPNLLLSMNILSMAVLDLFCILVAKSTVWDKL